MKLIYTSLFILLLIAGCTSSTELLQSGNYDAAIEKSVKKLLKKPNKKGELDVLNRAYTLANLRDNNVINELRISGRPDIWEDVFSRYSQMRRRQDKVARLPQQLLDQINFVNIDYNREVAEAKNKAAAFYYANGSKLLESGDRMSARKAYDQFAFISQYFDNYQDVDQKLQQALAIGTNHILFQMKNEARVAIPQDFENEILKISLSSINRRWVEFDTKVDDRIYYDYTIYLNLKRIEVSPQKIEVEKYRDTKLVPDGWEYILDSSGNVMKDSLGNDLKRSKNKEIYAYLTITKMDKRAVVQGSLDYYNQHTKQLIKTTPISSEFVFNYQYGEFAGDDNALTKESRKLIRNRAQPFPADLQMIFDTNQELKRLALEFVKRDVNLFAN
jgi:hypothetical protein